MPQGVAVFCGFDEGAICEHPVPSLTALDMNWERIGYEAAALLDRMMDGEPAPQEPVLLPPAGIVARASTDFFAVEDPLAAKALRFIAENLHTSIDVHDVVKALHTSRSTLQRSFRRHVGVPVSKEIRRLQLEKAKRLLIEPETHEVKWIASQTGFRDATTFCRVFRRELGMTPGQYRAQVLGEERSSASHGIRTRHRAGEGEMPKRRGR